MCFMTQYVFMTETKQLRISQKHSMRAIFMQIWQLEVIFWFMTEKCVHYLKVMKTYFHAVVISTSSDRNRPILRRAGASNERLWVLVCALGSTEGLQVHAEPSKFRVIKHMAWPVQYIQLGSPHRGQRPIFTMTANSESLQKFDNSCTARIFSLHDFRTILNAKLHGLKRAGRSGQN